MRLGGAGLQECCGGRGAGGGGAGGAYRRRSGGLCAVCGLSGGGGDRAKRAGATLTGVEPQTRKYQVAYPEELPAFEVGGALPFGYESTGAETRFTCGLDPVAASRRVSL